MNYDVAEKFVLETLAHRLPKDIFYHGVKHAADVIRAAEEIARGESVDGENLLIIKTAALCHDAGYIYTFWNNEEDGCNFARQHLQQFDYSSSQVGKVCEIIMGTVWPHAPVNLFQQIICDADLDYLGTDDFWHNSNELRKEFAAHGKVYSDTEWVKNEIAFLRKHQYFTAYSQKNRAMKKAGFLCELEEKLSNMEASL